jgi:DNA-binding response OmpR family regulator
MSLFTENAKSRAEDFKVLVVEDDPSSRRALTFLLKLEGFQASVAPTLADAIRQLDDHPNSVLLDLMLPDGNGAAVLRFIRTHHLPIRVAITSGASNWESMLQEDCLQPDAVFGKPLDFEQVVHWLSEQALLA